MQRNVACNVRVNVLTCVAGLDDDMKPDVEERSGNKSDTDSDDTSSRRTAIVENGYQQPVETPYVENSVEELGQVCDSSMNYWFSCSFSAFQLFWRSCYNYVLNYIAVLGYYRKLCYLCQITLRYRKCVYAFAVLAARRSVSDRRSCRWIQRSDLVTGKASSTWHGPVQGRSTNVYSWAKIISWQALGLLLSRGLSVWVSILYYVPSLPTTVMLLQHTCDSNHNSCYCSK